jgi:thiol-disulfide isomerase/thioredoxin/predicted Zn-dependent protease
MLGRPQRPVGWAGRALLVAATGFSLALPSGTALAAQAPEHSAEVLALADYYQSQDRIWEARAQVAELLTSEPHNLAAQRWYIASWQPVDEASRVEQQYRAWLAAEPDSEFRRLCLALAIAAARGSSPGWGEPHCAQLRELLDPLPKDPEGRFLALFTLNHSVDFGDCEGDLDAGREQMYRLLKSSSEARREFLRSRHGQPSSEPDSPDPRWLPLLQADYTDDPSRLTAALWLWDEETGESAGEGGSEEWLPGARKHAVAAARKALNSSQVSRVDAAYLVLRASGSKRATARAAKLLARLDPRWRAPGEASSAPQDQDAVEGKVRDALRQFDKDSNDEAINALRALYELSPDSHGNANGFAWAAALAGVQLDAALVAIDLAIEALRAETWLPSEASHWQNNVAEWSRGQGRTEAAYLDTRGWVLYGLERYPEAEGALRAALRLHQSGELHLHMGLIYARLGKDAAAIWNLAEGLPGTRPGRDEVERDGFAVFRKGFAAAGFWHPGGADGYLLLAASERQRRRRNEGSREDTGEASEPDPRFAPGTPFPDLAYRVGDQEHSLSELDGIVLVDMWATWCGPCVDGLPHLSEIAQQYRSRGVHTLALSVDDEQEEAEEFFAPDDQPAFARGWTGDQAMEQIGIDGIPAMFVLDENLEIAGHVFGYSHGDRRIEDILDALLRGAQ